MTWLMFLLAFLGGIIFVFYGIEAFKTKKYKTKHGKEFEGVSAQILGIICVLVGIATPVMLTVLILRGF